jgi:hypothetical protein
MDQGTSQSPPASAGQSAGERLDSWKEIAAYLKRDIRTVRRWEKALGLPVHRRYSLKRGLVYAYRHELDAWWHCDATNEKDALPASEQDAFLLELREIWRHVLNTDSLFELKGLLHRTRALLSASEFSLHPKRHQAEFLQEQIEQAIRWATPAQAVTPGGERNRKRSLMLRAFTVLNRGGPLGQIEGAIDWSASAVFYIQLIILIMLAVLAYARLYYFLRIRSEFGSKGSVLDHGFLSWAFAVGSSLVWIIFLFTSFQQRRVARQIQQMNGEVVMPRLIQGTLIVAFGAEILPCLLSLLYFFHFLLACLPTLFALTYLLLQVNQAGRRSRASSFLLTATAGMEVVKILAWPIRMVSYLRVPDVLLYFSLYLPELVVALFVIINLLRGWKQSEQESNMGALI